MDENNIDQLFTLLERDDEKRGYEDAIVNPDLQIMAQNVNALKDEIQRKIFKVTMFYEDYIQENNQQFDSCNRGAMVETADRLIAKKNIAINRIEKIREINALLTSEQDSLGVIFTYIKGFKKIGRAHV